jgi:hypothetical protein
MRGRVLLQCGKLAASCPSRQATELPMTAHPVMSTSDKVNSLLFEYNSLRSEIMQRNSIFNQYCVISVPASVAAVSVVTSAFPALGIVLFLVICCLLYVVFRIIEFDTLTAAARVRELEAQINEMAGERLLTWETDHGLSKIGYRDRFRYIFDPVLDYCRTVVNNRGTTQPVRPVEEQAE